MKNIPTVIVDGETYRYYKENWVDSMFILVNGDVMTKIIDERVKNLDSVPYEEVLEQTKKLKDSGYYSHALQLLDWLIDNYTKATNGVVILHTLSAMKTSCMRKVNKSQDAIEFYNDISAKFPSLKENPALLTSVTSAYCDIDDYETALQYARKACVASMDTHFAEELGKVIMRIKNKLGEDCFK